MDYRHLFTPIQGPRQNQVSTLPSAAYQTKIKTKIKTKINTKDRTKYQHPAAHLTKNIPRIYQESNFSHNYFTKKLYRYIVQYKIKQNQRRTPKSIQLTRFEINNAEFFHFLKLKKDYFKKEDHCTSKRFRLHFVHIKMRPRSRAIHLDPTQILHFHLALTHHPPRSDQDFTLSSCSHAPSTQIRPRSDLDPAPSYSSIEHLIIGDEMDYRGLSGIIGDYRGLSGITGFYH